MPQPTPSATNPTTSAPAATEFYWSKGERRPFISGKASVGLATARLSLAAGYGMPHWFWGGIEASGYVSPYFGAAQGGLHLDALAAELMINLRHTASFEYGPIARVPSVGKNELEQNKNKLGYNSLDVSLWGYLPYRDVLLGWEFTIVRPFNVGDSLIFEEYQRVVVGQNGVFTTKLSPMARLATKRAVYVGILAEQLSLLGRTKTMVLRIGPSVWGNLGDHWSVFGCWGVPVRSPDDLGAWIGSYAYLSLAYAFASGEASEARR